ncbi:MAG: ATP-binding cassette domain-containing protein [Caldilineaceae bacterium]
METRADPHAVEMRGIVKRFGRLLASDHVDFDVHKGEILALLGENGAGKTTLMRILYGLYHADAGEIRAGGRPAQIHAPPGRHRRGHRHGDAALRPRRPADCDREHHLGQPGGIQLDMESAHADVLAAPGRFGLEIDPRAHPRSLGGTAAAVEILKALYRDANVLILDEPTAVLVPQEVDQLFDGLRLLQQRGLAVIFISHKLHEVMSITNRITVLRHGRVAGSVATANTSTRDLAQMMVGRATIPAVKPPEQTQGAVALEVQAVRPGQQGRGGAARHLVAGAPGRNLGAGRRLGQRSGGTGPGVGRHAPHHRGPGGRQRARRDRRRPHDHDARRRGPHPRRPARQRGGRLDRSPKHGAGASGRVPAAACSTARRCGPMPRRSSLRTRSRRGRTTASARCRAATSKR